MKKELIQEYTARISQCNRSSLIVIVYEIILEYIKDAYNAYEQSDKKEFVKCLNNARNFLGELIHSLDMKYEISGQLFSLYLFWNRQMSDAIVKYSVEPLNGLQEMLTKLHNSFEQVSKTDKSSPLMKNTQKVYAGITYGRGELSEMAVIDINRGFQA